MLILYTSPVTAVITRSAIYFPYRCPTAHIGNIIERITVFKTGQTSTSFTSPHSQAAASYRTVLLCFKIITSVIPPPPDYK